jgi:hypothetical protein
MLAEAVGKDRPRLTYASRQADYKVIGAAIRTDMLCESDNLGASGLTEFDTLLVNTLLDGLFTMMKHG